MSNKIVNTGFIVNNKDLSLIMPKCEFYNAIVNNTSGDPNGTITLQLHANGNSNTNSYKVFPFYSYNAPGGSAGTYNAISASTSAKSIMISNITNTSFSWYFNKTTGDIWNGAINFLVVFN